MDFLIIAIFAALAFLGMAAQLWGVDSRQSFIDPRLTEPNGVL